MLPIPIVARSVMASASQNSGWSSTISALLNRWGEDPPSGAVSWRGWLWCSGIWRSNGVTGGWAGVRVEATMAQLSTGFQLQAASGKR
ncbi:hypothetical protein MACH18_09350 [Phaeobacter italicus]|nr:hypothetical protein MACH18_09350 [Phaeobacter italicus]